MCFFNGVKRLTPGNYIKKKIRYPGAYVVSILGEHASTHLQILSIFLCRFTSSILVWHLGLYSHFSNVL